MSAINPAGWLQNAGVTHTAAQMRTYAGSLLAGLAVAGATTRTRGGVHPGAGGALAVTANGTPNMSVNVASGSIFVPGSQAASQGVYFCHNDAAVNLAIATAPGAGTSRIDLVVAQVLDSFYSGSSNLWQLAVVTGTAASSPASPTVPANSLVLASIAVGASVVSINSGNITDNRIYAAALGGFIPDTSTARPSNPYESMVAYDIDTDMPIYYTGSKWLPFQSPCTIVNVCQQGNGVTVSSSSFVNAFATQVTLAKKFLDTRVLLRLGFNGFATGANTRATLGANFAGTDYSFGNMWFTTNALHRGAMFELIVPGGIAKGSYVINLRAQVDSNSLDSDANDRISLTAEEIV